MATLLDDLVRRSLKQLSPYVAGTTAEQARRRYGLSRVVKLSSNENPLGTSPRAMEAIQRIERLNIYVDDDYRALREKIAERHGVTAVQVALGHGSNEILAQFYTTFTEPGDEVVMAVPTFSLYRSNALISGAVAVEVPLREGVHDLDAMLAAVNSKTKMMVICDPNNPTGTWVERDAFETFVQALPERVLLVLDQAYREYMSGGVDGIAYIGTRPRTLVLRTASKIFGLAALRFGYAVASEEIVSWLLRTRLPFNVALPALVAVDAALDDLAFIEESIARNAAGKAQLAAGFERWSLPSYPSGANFVAVGVPFAADAVYDGLLKRGVIVRSGDALRMPGYLRVTIGTEEENAVFLEALDAVLEAGLS
jgi:histidinol-phosphate aminotransferase